MTVVDRLRTVGTWSGQDVDAGSVQGQLTKLWRAAGEHAHHVGEPAAARTNVLTLVVYAETEALTSHVQEAVGALAEHHPSRTILVRAEPGAEVSSLAVDIVTRCRIDRPQVCYEQIVLHASGSVVEQVSSAVASLLLRDLPTILWWPDDIRQQSELLRRLMDLCDGVIIDSASFAAPPVSLPTLLSLLQQESSIVADLQWARLNGWRDITAQFFDTPASRAHLDGLTSVEVDVRAGDRPGLPAAGLLYVAWLAGRLGWRLDRATLTPDADGHFALTSSRGQVSITLRSVPHDETTGDQISAVRLQAGTADNTAQFAIHCASEDQVTTRTAEADLPPVERSMRLAAPTDSMVLAQMLGYLRRDAVYEQTMGLLGAWLGVSPGGQ